tara:strand:- start:41 stop:286 length:246 start_codon:yes stop_codon:yes gene_type:complete
MRYTEEQYVESASIQARIIDELNTELKALKKVNETQAEQLILHGVSNRRELLIDLLDKLEKGGSNRFVSKEWIVDNYLQGN